MTGFHKKTEAGERVGPGREDVSARSNEGIMARIRRWRGGKPKSRHEALRTWWCQEVARTKQKKMIRNDLIQVTTLLSCPFRVPMVNESAANRVLNIRIICWVKKDVISGINSAHDSVTWLVQR